MASVIPLEYKLPCCGRGCHPSWFCQPKTKGKEHRKENSCWPNKKKGDYQNFFRSIAIFFWKGSNYVCGSRLRIQWADFDAWVPQGKYFLRFINDRSWTLKSMHSFRGWKQKVACECHTFYRPQSNLFCLTFNIFRFFKIFQYLKLFT